MKYYILEGNMKPDVPAGPEFKKILDAHHAFMVPYFQAGKETGCIDHHITNLHV